MFLTLTERFNFAILGNPTLWIPVYQALLSVIHTDVNFQRYVSHYYLPDLIPKSFFVLLNLPRKVSWPFWIVITNVEFVLLAVSFIREKLTNVRISFGIGWYDVPLVHLFLYIIIILILVWYCICETAWLMMDTWPVARMIADDI
jgi:hypothetical protein